MEYLFNGFDSYELKEHQKRKLLEAINDINEKQLLNTKLEEWSEHFESQYHLDVPSLHEDKIQMDHQDTKIDARGLPNRAIFDMSRPVMIDGTEISFFVPFDGDPQLFKCCPHAFNTNPPRASIINKELVFTYYLADHNGEEAKKEFTQQLSSIRSYLHTLRTDFQEFNESIKGLVHSRLHQRFDKFKKDQEMATAIGIPLRRRDNAPTTYVVPSVQRKIVSKPLPSLRVSAEPILILEEYNFILTIMKNMALVMERSPSAFKHMEEEHLRDHFLVQLNAQYEGKASGETFNFQGKTDILVREDNKNIFIAECKFWTGGVGFIETIDQLLKYLSWRDTKTAIIIFNKNKNLSNVLQQIPDLVRSHQNFLKDWITQSGETEFQYILHHNNDKERELYLTVQVYDIPI